MDYLLSRLKGFLSCLPFIFCNCRVHLNHYTQIERFQAIDKKSEVFEHREVDK